MSKGQSIRIVIADDHPIVREGFSAIVEAEDDLTVVAQAWDGREALAAVAEHEPDIVLMDLRMPELDGVAAIRELRERQPDVRAIVLTTFDSDDLVYDAIRAGARGYLLKDVSPAELVEAIRTVHRGGSLIQPVAIERLLDRLGPDRPAEDQGVEPLTRREKEVLQIMARGGAQSGDRGRAGDRGADGEDSCRERDRQAGHDQSNGGGGEGAGHGTGGAAGGFVGLGLGEAQARANVGLIGVAVLVAVVAVVEEVVGFEPLVTPVGGDVADAIAQGRLLVFGEGFEVVGDGEVLVEIAHGGDAATQGGDGLG